MATKKFPSELAGRGTVKVTDKLLIHNIDTGATEYTTVADLLTAISVANIISGNGIGINWKFNAIFGNTQIATAFDSAQNSGNVMKFLVNTASGIAIEVMRISGDGRVIIGGTTPTAAFQVVGLAEYTDNAAAVGAGLTAGAFYRTGDLLKVVH